MMNDTETFSTHRKSTWINGTTNVLQDMFGLNVTRNTNSLEMLSEVSCMEADAKVRNETNDMKQDIFEQS